MHEFHMAQKIIDVIKKEMSKEKAARLKNAKVSVGELSGIKPHTLRMYFEQYSKDTPLEGAAFDIEEAPVTSRCKDCNKEFAFKDGISTCPWCKGRRVERLSGTEVNLLSITTE